MEVTARLDLVVRDGSREELVRLASAAAREGGDVRWRVGEDVGLELHVRFRSEGRGAREFLSAILDDYLPMGM
jgi:hypothetical protein